ncbi:Hypothetical predicted protein [Cloeon dipterum]|uniref:HID1 domain-containing protein n=1 Tax=Cloeon dipterum TaxID=197152 RepID=A0A8S1BUJ4_9INSE|nr:Hypothetical predicted protein [Cloeon dipterum]
MFCFTCNLQDKAEDLNAIDSCEFIWESGVGAALSLPYNAAHDSNRTELLKLLLTCFSETMYYEPSDSGSGQVNRWVSHFTSPENRHALPVFTSLLNVCCSYDPVGLGLVPYNHLIFNDSREPLVETALQILIATLDHEGLPNSSANADQSQQNANQDNLFINYLSRIHRDEDFGFVLRGFTRLLNNPLAQTYLPNSTKKVSFHQELLIFFWKFCDYNKKFLYFVLKSSDVLDILVPILYHLNDSRADQSRVGLMHIGVFILLLLSGERNFGVRLNKPYTATIPMDIPVFTGTHADLLITVFHKIITTGHQRLQPLFDCLLTILVNVSPYLKTLSMVASTKLLHLLEAFSTPWFLFSAPTNHHLVFFLLEIFNNIIQYQFDGNSNLVYTIIRKRQVFHSLANLPSDYVTINRSLTRRSMHGKTRVPAMSRPSTPSSTVPATSESKEVKSEGAPEADQNRTAEEEEAMEGSRPAMPAEPGTLKATLPATPGIEKITERESAHPSSCQLNELTVGSLLGPDSELPSQPKSAETSLLPITEETDGVPQRTRKTSLTGSESGSTSSSLKRAQSLRRSLQLTEGSSSPTQGTQQWNPTSEWVYSWKSKLPLQTIMRLLQVLVPQVEKICIDKGLTDESEILKFLQHGTLVGLLPVPHPILIRKYQANLGTTSWFRTYMWGVIYLRNVDPPIWYNTDVKLFEIQRV